MGSLASRMRAARAQATDDVSDGCEDLDAEEWRVVMHFLAPEVVGGGAGDGTPASPEVLPRAGRGRGAAGVGGSSWRRGVVDVAARCYPDLPRAKALMRVNTLLARPHVRLAVDAFREHEAMAVADHRAVLRERALDLLDGPPPAGTPYQDPETGETRLAPTSARDLAAWVMSQVQVMRFLADMDGHWAKDREEAAGRRLALVAGAREQARGLQQARGAEDVAADLRGKLALASRAAMPPPSPNDVDGVAQE